MHSFRIESYRFWQMASGPECDSVGAHMPAFCWPGLTCTLSCAAAGLQTPKVVGTGVTTPRNKSGHASGVDLDDADREPGGIRRTKRCVLTGLLGGGWAQKCSSWPNCNGPAQHWGGVDVGLCRAPLTLRLCISARICCNCFPALTLAACTAQAAKAQALCRHVYHDRPGDKRAGRHQPPAPAGHLRSLRQVRHGLSCAQRVCSIRCEDA